MNVIMLIGVLCWKVILKKTQFFLYNHSHNLHCVTLDKFWKSRMQHDDLIYLIGAQNTESADLVLLQRRVWIPIKFIKIYLNYALYGK